MARECRVQIEKMETVNCQMQIEMRKSGFRNAEFRVQNERPLRACKA